MRNPFRFTFRPGTGELWVGDVGQDTWEEIDRLTSTASMVNLGWPCYEGPNAMPGFQAAGLNACATAVRDAVVGDRPVLLVQPREPRRRERQLLDGERLRDQRDLVLRRRRLPGGVQRRALLRRPLAQLHLGDDAGLERAARPDEHPDLRQPGRLPGRPRRRAERRSLLRRLRRRNDPPAGLPERDLLDGQLPRRLLQQQDGDRIAGAQPLRDGNRLLVGRRQPGSVDHRRQLLGSLDRQLLVRGRHVQVHRIDQRRRSGLGRRHPRDRPVARSARVGLDRDDRARQQERTR